MSALLSKLKLTGMVVNTPEQTLAILATRGEWSALAQAVSQAIRSANAGTYPDAGSSVTFASLGLSPRDFQRTKATATKAIGDYDYSGITSAARVFGLNVRTTVDEFRAFYVPADWQKVIDKTQASKAKAAAKAKAKAAKAAAK